MNRKLFTAAAAAAVALSSTSAAFADPHHGRGRGHDDRYDRGEGHARHHWRKGERLDRRYHSRAYVVDDYRRYGWRAPPPGYAYYRTDDGGDVVLAAIASGLIASVLADALR